MESLPSLLDASGTEITPIVRNEKLQNKRLALYFAAGWCPMCTSFEPALLQFRQAAEDSGNPIELIYVSSDRSEAEQAQRAGGMDMWSVPFHQTKEIKQKYKVWAGAEVLKLGLGRRSGVPALVVLDNSGEEMAFVAAESQGVRALETWPLDEERGIWGL